MSRNIDFGIILTFTVFAGPKKTPRTFYAGFRIAPPVKLVSSEPHPSWESAGKVTIGMTLGRNELLG